MVREFKYFKGNTGRSKNYYFIIGGSYLMLPYVGYRSENYMNGLIEHVRSVYRNFEVNEGTINNIKGHIETILGETVQIQYIIYPETSIPL